MTHQTQPRPASVYLLLLALAVQGVSGLGGGFGLIADPTGAALGLPAEWLEGSPFPDYLIPGLVLFVILGVLPLVITYALWVGAPWSWAGALIVGMALLGWIGVEILVIGYQPRPPLQLIYGLLGLIIVVLTLLPSVRKHFGRAT